MGSAPVDLFDPLVGPPARELGSVPAPPPDSLDEGTEPADLAELVPTVDEGTVRGILAGLGNVASVVDRAAPGLWKFTDDELNQLAPPICRLANRNPTLRRALLHGDFVVIAMGLSGYVVRNVATRKEALDGQNRSNQVQGAPRTDRSPGSFGVVDGSFAHAGHAGGVAADATGGPR